jgi:hypothetical protein
MSYAYAYAYALCLCPILYRMNEETAVLRVLLRRGLASDELSNLPVHFEIGVLQRYRGVAGFSLIRTNTVGRVKKEGGWSLDFGIAPAEDLVHVFGADLLRLPTDEREHWAASAVSLPVSKVMLQMRLALGSCIDDGEVRRWD